MVGRASCRELRDLRSFEALLRPDTGCNLVGFWSQHDPISVRAAAAYRELAEEHGQRSEVIGFYEVWNDLHPDVAHAARVSVTPALLVVHKGAIVEALVGRLPADQLRKTLERLSFACRATAP